MKKEKFKYLYSFKYNNKDYIYLVARNYPFYFLEYDSKKNNFDYPDINTFTELYRKFYSNNGINFSVKDELKRIRETLYNINFDITPLVRTTSGLLSVIIALSFTGCKQTDGMNDVNSTEPTSIVEMQDKSNEIYNYFKNYGMDVIDKEYDGSDYIFVRDFINSDNKHQITLQDHEEFRKFKNIDFIPAWNDVTEAFKSNENIDDDKKDIILKSIDNMRNSKELNGIDLSVLYANAKRMKIKYISAEEITNAANKDSVYAYFDSADGTVYLPSDRNFEEFEFIHEVLGHGTLAYREKTEDSLVVFDCTNYLMLPEEDRYAGYSVGTMVGEGGANMIAHLATNNYNTSSFYELFEEELRVIAQLCNVSIGELLNHKGISLYDLMYENGIDTPVEYIFKMDGICKGQLYCEFSDLMERLFVDATEEKIVNSNEQQQNEIIKDTVEIIRNSYFKDKGKLSFGYTGGSIDYNFEESANKYEENINGLRSKK